MSEKVRVSLTTDAINLIEAIEELKLTDKYVELNEQMADKEILELAKSCGFDSSSGLRGNSWKCWEKQLLIFASEMYKKGHMNGFLAGWEGSDKMILEEVQELNRNLNNTETTESTT